jgi:hypothetical protein
VDQINLARAPRNLSFPSCFLLPVGLLSFLLHTIRRSLTKAVQEEGAEALQEEGAEAAGRSGRTLNKKEKPNLSNGSH